jgi:hypothetical protein
MATLIDASIHRLKVVAHRMVWSVQDWFQRVPHHSGWWVILITLAVLILVAMWGWASNQQGQARRRLAIAATHQLVSEHRNLIEGPPPADTAEFDALLVPSPRISNVVQDLFNEADDHNVELLGGTYSTQQDPVGGFGRYVVVMPMKGEARDVRQFVLSALTEQPALAVQRLQLRRERVSDGIVNAQVDWVLFTRPSQSAPQRTVR